MKVYSPEEYGRIVSHENVHFCSGNYETRSSKLADENAKCRVEFERSFGYLGLVAACSKIARTSVKVRKTKRLPLVLLRAQKRKSEQALHWPLVGSLRWDERRTSVTTLHVSVVWAFEHFKKNKASHDKKRQFNCCFLSLFYFLSIISTFVTNITYFIEVLFRLRICLFRYVFCRRESNKTCYFSTVLTPLLLTMVSVSHIYYRQIARLHRACLNHRECLIWGKFVKIPKQKFESQLTVINPCSVLW